VRCFLEVDVDKQLTPTLTLFLRTNGRTGFTPNFGASLMRFFASTTDKSLQTDSNNNHTHRLADRDSQ
jgi:hypothetical protein